MNRGNYVISQLVHACTTNSITDLIIVHEHRGEPGVVYVQYLLLLLSVSDWNEYFFFNGMGFYTYMLSCMGCRWWYLLFDMINVLFRMDKEATYVCCVCILLYMA